MYPRNGILVQLAVISFCALLCSSAVAAGEWKSYSWDNEYGPAQPTRGVRIDSFDGEAALLILRMPRFHRGTVDVHLAPNGKAVKRIANLRGFQARDREASPIRWRVEDGQFSKLRAWRQDGGLRFEIAEKVLHRWQDAASLEVTYENGSWEFDLTGIAEALDWLFEASKSSDQVPYSGSDGTTSAIMTQSVAPEWPPREASTRKGVVRVLLIVSPDGSPRNLSVWRSTLPRHGFHQAAIEAASRMHFAPALVDGTPVEVYYEVFVDFGLNSESPKYLRYTGD